MSRDLLADALRSLVWRLISEAGIKGPYLETRSFPFVAHFDGKSFGDDVFLIVQDAEDPRKVQVRIPSSGSQEFHLDSPAEARAMTREIIRLGRKAMKELRS